MKIESYDVSFESRHSLMRSDETKTLIKNISIGNSHNSNNNIFENDPVSISSAARQKYINKTFSTTNSFSEVSKIKSDKNTESGNRQKELISQMVSHVAGFDVSITEEMSIADAAVKKPDPRLAGGNFNMPVELTFEEIQLTEIKEKTIVNTAGMVKTEDGREIKFGMHLGIERDFRMEKGQEASANLGKLIDPLVIQFEDGPPEFSDNVFSFDLNSDGKEESLQRLGKGSGFLAFDINKDGKINDGSELFGAMTGNGFAELSAFDDDGNGWIDENDEAYSQLSVWTPGSDDEKGEIKDLASLDIGAVYLGSAESSHTITDEKGSTKAQLKSTGMYLKESGEAGHVYQLDLADLKKDENLKPENKIAEDSEKLPEPGKKPDYFKGIAKQMEEFMDSLDKIRNNPYTIEPGGRSIFDELLDDLKKQLEEMMKAFDKKKKDAEKANERYEKNLFNNGNINFEI